MRTKFFNTNKAVKVLAVTALVGAMATPALATTSTDADFNGFATKITGWLTGSLGKTIGYVGVGVGAAQLFRQNWAAAAGWIAIGLMLSIGPSVVDTIFGAVI